jgi:hypothetical protein
MEQTIVAPDGSMGRIKHGDFPRQTFDPALTPPAVRR